MVLLSAFATFCTLAVSVPLGIRWYVVNATTNHQTALTAISSTVVVEEKGQPLAVTESAEISEGATIRTDSTSQAILTFFEDSTAVLYNNAQVTLVKTRTPRFDLSPRPDMIVLGVEKGRVRIGVAPAINSPLYFEVRLPQGMVVLEEGSYSVEVTDQESQIITRYGQAFVTAAGRTVKLIQGQRTTIARNEAPAEPMPAAQPLLVNGNFQQGLTGWVDYNEQGVDGGEVDGTIEIVSANDRRALSFSRLGEDGNHCETGIIQKINKDVRDYTYLKLHLDVSLIYQSLSGGGFQGSEYPVMVRLDYKDIYGNDQFWVHGFYYQNDQGYPIPEFGEQIPRYLWYPYETGNLLELLADTRPVYIKEIRIYASGWEYQSMISEVELTVK